MSQSDPTAANRVATNTELPPANAAAVERAKKRVVNNVADMVGETPLVRLASFDKPYPGVEIYSKAEFMNPGGSVKDRAASHMIRTALADGSFNPENQVLIDSSSGNTGIAYSLNGAALGFRVQLVLPENVSWARKMISGAFGTEVIYSDPLEGSDGAIRLCRELVEATPSRYFFPNQYWNEANPGAHFETTGKEIFDQTDGRITHFVAGIGTSGTVMGAGRRLKRKTRCPSRGG